MNIISFKNELESALSKELMARADEYKCYEMVSFDLGTHPWHGYIELSFLTLDDCAGFDEIGDWKLYNFSNEWHSVDFLGEWMRLFYESNTVEHSIQLFVAAAEVARGVSVTEALMHYRKSENFFVSVYNPDDPLFINYCAAIAS